MHRIENCSEEILTDSCKVVNFGLNGVATSICVVLGLIGAKFSLNAIGQQHSSHKHIYLKTLIFWDSILLLSTFGYYGLDSIFSCTRLRNYAIFVYLTVASHPVASTAFTASSLLIVLVTGQRLVAVVSPMFARAMSAHYSMNLLTKMIAAFVSVFSCALSIPAFFEPQITSCFDQQSNVIFQAVPSKLRQNAYYFLYYRVLFRGFLLSTLGPFLAISVMSILIIVNTHRSYVRRLQLQQYFRRHRQPITEVQSIAAVEGLLIVKFLLTHWIPPVLDIWEATTYNRDDLTQRNLFSLMVSIGSFLVCANSATNCVVYLKCGRMLFGMMKVALRRISTGKSLFTNKEVQLLHQSRDILFQHRRNSNALPFGHHMLYSMLLKNPSICHEITGSSQLVGDFEELCRNDMFIQIGHRITNLFSVLLFTITCKTTQVHLCGPLRHIGFIHARLGIRLPSSMWNHMKYFMLEMVNDLQMIHPDIMENGMHGQFDEAGNHEALDDLMAVRQRAWEKLMCLVIREIKYGYTNGSKVQDMAVAFGREAMAVAFGAEAMELTSMSSNAMNTRRN